MTNIELINLTLDGIRRSVEILSIYRQQEEKCCCFNPKDEKMKNHINDIDMELNSIRLKLRENLTDVSNYLIDKGMIGGVDSAIFKIPYQLIFERKTEKDFEE